VLGLSSGPRQSPHGGPARAELAASELRERAPAALSATPVDAAFARAVALADAAPTVS
jgi:hypothetical protein